VLALGFAALWILFAGCATAGRPQTGPNPPAGVTSAAAATASAGPSAEFGAAREAEIALQCLLPAAQANADTVRAPVDELRALAETVAVAASPTERRLDLVAEVEAGTRPVANAAWWGVDETDATGPLQAAFDSPARAVFVPNTGAPWQVEPLRLSGETTVVLEDGAVLEAKRGSFIDRGSTLLSAENASDIIIWGYGATIRMRKSEYSRWPYAESEWRHALNFESVRNLGVYGVRVEEAGGDGIYLGRTDDGVPYCENVVIRDVVLNNGNRQGLSVVSARRVLIEDSTFSNTGGTLPQAGIDFEPNRADERLEDITVRRSLFLRNRGAGIQFFLWYMTEDSTPISVSIEDSEFRGNTLGLLIARAGGDPSGRILFSNSPVGWRRWVTVPADLEVVYE
jgi:hypothetical protein